MRNFSPGISLDPVKIRAQVWLLIQPMPVWAESVRMSAARSLFEAAQHGDKTAARALIHVWNGGQTQSLCNQLAEYLQHFTHENAIDALWESWMEQRHPFLLDCATNLNTPATSASPASTISLLMLDYFKLIKSHKSGVVSDLIYILSDPDSNLRQKSREELERLTRKQDIVELCTVWWQTRHPELEEIIHAARYLPSSNQELSILVALKFNHPQTASQASAEQVETLLAACRDVDTQISTAAHQALLNLQDPSAVTALCSRWASSRDPFLANLVAQARHMASSPFQLRLLTALKTARQEICSSITAAQLHTLLQFLTDADTDVASQAQLALLNLTQPESVAEFCRLVLDSPNPKLTEIAVKAGYAPKDPDQRALFLFLTQQWAAYDSFDYDHRHLRLIYGSATAQLRQRIASLIQQVGRTDYLNILVGIDFKQISTTSQEAAILFRILKSNQEWDRLWQLVDVFDLHTSIEIIRELNQVAWHPKQDREDYARLSALVNQQPLATGTELTQSLPLALHRAVLKVNGRINNVNFHPSESVLAIGTSHPRLVLWDFNKAKIIRSIGGFDHSVSQVVYNAEGTLFSGQRAKVQSRCSIYTWKDGIATFLGSHTGSVTALLPVNQTQLLSTGRDQQIILWDITTNRPIQQTHFDFWARSAALSQDGSTAILLHSALNLLSLPNLTPIPHHVYTPRLGEIRPSVTRCAAFSPDDRDLVVGQNNGQVLRYTFQGSHNRSTRHLLLTHPAAIQGINFLPSHNLVITASRDGLISFTQWNNGKPFGALQVPSNQLTSLHISLDGAFMATGTGESSMHLWDLRPLDLPSLVSAPIASIPSSQLSLISAYTSAAEFSLPVRNSLSVLHLLLQRRYRFDVQLSEAPTIQVGEFDILLQE